MPINPSSKVCQTSEQVTAGMGAESAVLHLGTGRYFGLNETSSEIWSYIEKPRSVSEICSHLMTIFKIDPKRCETEVLKHLDGLLEDQLIELADETPQ